MRMIINQHRAWPLRPAIVCRGRKLRPRNRPGWVAGCWSVLSTLLVVAAGHSMDTGPVEPLDDDPRPSNAAIEGEDIGGTRGEHPLQQIGSMMADVQARLHSRDTSQETLERQRNIVERLSSMIEREAQSASQKSAAAGQPQRIGAEPGQRPGSTAGPGTTAGSSDGPGATDALLRRIWGQLPDQVRHQVETPLHEKFLPQYDDLIQDYFKRLADDQTK